MSDDADPAAGYQGDALAVVLTPVASPELLAASCALAAVAVDAVPTAAGAVAVCRSASPGDPEHVAETISRLLIDTPVLLVVRHAGALVATRWISGQASAEVAPGLLLNGAPPELEGLLVGTLEAADLPGVVSSTAMGRWRATWVLARSARIARKAKRMPPASSS